MATITLKGEEIHTNGELPKIGDQPPPFTLIDSSLSEKSLSDFSGKRCLLYIAPSLDTSVCLLSTKKFNDTAKQNPNVQITIITSDLPFALERICGIEKMENITTLSLMRGHTFAEDYGVLLIDGPLAGLTARAVLVLDENGKVLYSELVPEIAQEPNYDQALTTLLNP